MVTLGHVLARKGRPQPECREERRCWNWLVIGSLVIPPDKQSGRRPFRHREIYLKEHKIVRYKPYRYTPVDFWWSVRMLPKKRDTREERRRLMLVQTFAQGGTNEGVENI